MLSSELRACQVSTRSGSIPLSIRSGPPRELSTDLPTQGNLDPLALLAGGRALDEGIDDILRAFAGRPHIMNLGHGILPQTPIANVERLVARLRGGG